MLRVHRVEFYALNMHTRFPFRYGIASMSRLPHLFVRAELEIDGQRCMGVAADGLAPKWFSKDPNTDYERDDLPEMLRVIEHASDTALELGTKESFFAWWIELYRGQHVWAAEQGVPLLLASFGCSLLERAVLEAFCKRHETTFFAALQSNQLELELKAVHPGLPPLEPADVLPSRPLSSILLRHTIGISDALTDAETQASNKAIRDGLPHSLVSNIHEYGLTHFKIKLSGDRQQDQERLRNLEALLSDHVGPSMRFTLDANEQFNTLEAFQDVWEQIISEPRLRHMVDQSLLFVEQPVHRDTALNSETGETFRDWTDAPPIIIDESDSDFASLPRALELGYAGTSHKNCKGVIKSVVSLASIQQLSRFVQPKILSGEDLANVGPVALNQDLAVAATLGIPHVERNGHHYFAGLQMYPRAIQQQACADHADLYRWHDRGFACLQPRAGKLQLESVNRAPLGVANPIDTAEIERWYDSSG